MGPRKFNHLFLALPSNNCPIAYRKLYCIEYPLAQLNVNYVIDSVSCEETFGHEIVRHYTPEGPLTAYM